MPHIKLPQLNLKRVLFVLGALVIVITSPSIVSFAQDLNSTQSLELTPPSQEVKANPGQTVSFKVTLKNRSKNPLPIKTRVEDFTASGDEGQVELIEKGSYSVSGWTTVVPDSFTLGPGASKTVSGTVKIPNKAAGGRYGAVVFGVEAKTAQENAAAVSQEIASLFLVKIAGPTNENLKLNNFTAPAFSEFGPVPFTLHFSNNGNVHTTTTGLVSVNDMFNRKVADIVVPPTNVFPGSQRNISAQLEKRFLFGKYSATAIMYFGEKNETINAVTYFYVLPLRIIAITIVALLILITLRKRLKKAMKVLFS